MAPGPPSLLQESLWASCMPRVKNVMGRLCGFQNAPDKGEVGNTRTEQKGKVVADALHGPSKQPSLLTATTPGTLVPSSALTDAYIPLQGNCLSHFCSLLILEANIVHVLIPSTKWVLRGDLRNGCAGESNWAFLSLSQRGNTVQVARCAQGAPNKGNFVPVIILLKPITKQN